MTVREGSLGGGAEVIQLFNDWQYTIYRDYYDYLLIMIVVITTVWVLCRIVAGVVRWSLFVNL